MKKLFILLIAVAFFKPGKSQDAALDFSNMHNAYLGNFLSLDFEVRQYESLKDAQGIFIGAGKVRKSKRDYYSLFDKQELVVVNDKMLSVDYLSKQMCFYNSLASSKTGKMKAAVMDTLLLERADSVKFNGITADGKWYSVFTSGEEAYRTDITIDIQTNLVREIVYYYPPASSENDYGASKVVIRYTALSTAKPDDSYFNLKKYISEGGNPQPAAAYQTYHFTVIN